MNCELYYMHDGKPMICKADHHGRIDDLMIRFHRTMQNVLEREVYKQQNDDGKEETKYRKVLRPRHGKDSYRLICVKRAGIWYDDFATHSTPDQLGERPSERIFSEGRECELPDRLVEFV